MKPITGTSYNVLKFLAQIALPALGTLYFTLAGIWGLPSAEEVVGTIVAIDTFLGVILQLSSKAYAKSDEKFDGAIKLAKLPGGGKTYSLEVDGPLDILEEKDEILFKVDKSKKPEIIDLE